MSLYPLKFHPILKERLWGGTKLVEQLEKPKTEGPIGESWELSGVVGNVSVISNGSLAGTPLNELIREQKEQLLGKEVWDRFGAEFPILIKFIDADKQLSIQVHPDNVLAQRRHGSKGKTEMWYIMDAATEAELIIGFKESVTKEQYKKSLENDTLLNLLHYEPVKEGDAFFINTGKIHAIGSGVLLAEIQQTSDITYRVFDFNRRGKDGKLRELHTDLALDAMDYLKKDDFRIDYETAANRQNKMVHCPYFNTNFLSLTDSYQQDLSLRDSFSIYICVKGEAILSTKEGSANLQRGETVLVPASSSTVSIETEGVRLLEVYL